MLLSLIVSNYLQQLKDVWQKKPYHISAALECVAGSYTMNDVQNSVDSDFLEAGRGTFQEGMGGWNMAAVSKVREDPREYSAFYSS